MDASGLKQQAASGASCGEMRRKMQTAAKAADCGGGCRETLFLYPFALWGAGLIIGLLCVLVKALSGWNFCMSTFNTDWWGNGYFEINDKGHVVVCPDPDVPEAKIDLAELVASREKSGQRLPALFCFPQILPHRVRSINRAFKQARESYGYTGDYFLVFPIKVNQHRRVIEALTQSGEPLGLEAGSKAELMVVLAHAGRTRSVIVCNGYKDREYIRMALNGEKMGHKVYIVIEKLSELRLVLEEAKRLEVQPRLGVRARLASQGSGKWQASGGEKSKFGLSATQVLELVSDLKEHDKLDCLQLIHFHLGSQMSNIRDIANGVRESARFYVELAKLGAKIECFDVGGGLGVDYEGTRSQSDGSVNYGLGEYANNIIWAIGDACKENNLPEPTVITESGRATTAYHTVLVSNVIGVERICDVRSVVEPKEDAPRPLQSMWHTWQAMHEAEQHRSLREWLHDSQLDLNDVHHGFIVGDYSLEERAYAEQLYLSICVELKKMLDPLNKSHRILIDELEERMADKLYVNFSLFQSLPDAWGIEQLFPVMPLEFLNKPLTRRAVLLDITCDSDGAIKHYMDGDDEASTMPFPEYDIDNPPYIGFFMVGAYQEILGNMHNLFGDTEAVDVYVYEDGKVRLRLSDEGDTVADMLQYVQLDPSKLLSEFTREVRDSSLDETLQRQLINDFKTGLYGYTYLEEDQI